MKKLNTKGLCPKCGHWGVDMAYIPPYVPEKQADGRVIPPPPGRSTIPHDWMLCKCQRCGFETKALPLDSQEVES